MERPFKDRRLVGPFISSSKAQTSQFDKVVIEVNSGHPKYTVLGKYNTRGSQSTGLRIDTHALMLNGNASFSADDRVEILADEDSKITIKERSKNLVNIHI